MTERKKKHVVKQRRNNAGGITGKGFKSGQSGNPKGRPTINMSYSDTVRELLSSQEIKVHFTVNGKEKVAQVTSDRNLYYGVASAQIMEALKGNHKAAKELIDRAEGKAQQKIDVTSEGERINRDPVTVIFEEVKKKK